MRIPGQPDFLILPSTTLSAARKLDSTIERRYRGFGRFIVKKSKDKPP
jgi:hypothetical protein